MGKGDRARLRGERRKLRKALNGQSKPGERTLSGQLSRAAGNRDPQGPPPVVVARVAKLGVSPDDAATPYAGTGHGLLYLAGVLSHEGYQVAERYRRLRHAYQCVVNRGPAEPASAALPYAGEYRVGRQSEAAEGDGAPVPRSQLVETAEEREVRIRRNWEAVEAALTFRGPCLRVLNDVCVRDDDVRRNERDRRWMVLAVECLATLWGLEPRDMVPRKRAG